MGNLYLFLTAIVLQIIDRPHNGLIHAFGRYRAVKTGSLMFKMGVGFFSQVQEITKTIYSLASFMEIHK